MEYNYILWPEWLLLCHVDCCLTGPPVARGLGNTAREHMERALAHVREAYVAFNEMGQARTVQQLVNDLVRIHQVMDGSRPGQSQRL
jgi:hypothetical protein